MSDQLEPQSPRLHNPYKETREKLSLSDKLAVWITDRVGTMAFFGIIFVWTVIWLPWNIFAPERFTFDPAPAFVIWLFMSNMVQIFLMPLIMVGQNVQSKHSEARSEHDLRVNIKAEHEIKTILVHLEHQNAILEKILEKDVLK